MAAPMAALGELLQAQVGLVKVIIEAVRIQVEHQPQGAAPTVVPETELLTVKEAAALVRCTPKALYNRHSRGQLPGAVKDGDRLLVRRDELLRSFAEVRVSSPRRSKR